MLYSVLTEQILSKEVAAMLPDVNLKTITEGDLIQVRNWLLDPEVNQMWYGCDENNQPLHTGYDLGFEEPELNQLVVRLEQDRNRDVMSVLDADNKHVGEGQLVYEWSLLEAQLFLLIGEKELWHHHYGTAALIKLLDYAFIDKGLHRIWVDVPEYNTNALHMVDHVGFVVEGHFRGAHRKEGEWYDLSLIHI